MRERGGGATKGMLVMGVGEGLWGTVSDRARELEGGVVRG